MNAIDPPSRDSKDLFTRKHSSSAGRVTSEGIEADLEAFRKAGGEVEVLGVTHTLKKLEVASAQAATLPARPSGGGRRGSSR